MDSRLVSIFLEGIDNLKTVYPDYKKKGKSWKTFQYYVVDTLIPKKRHIPSNLFFIHVKNHRDEEISHKFTNIVYRGNWFYNISEFRTEYTLASPLSIQKRIGIWIRSLISYKYTYKDFSLWLDYNFLVEFLTQIHPSSCTARCHYDEFATWLGGLSKIFGYRFEIYQHGVLSDKIIIPHKFYCNKINVFDDYSKKIFKKNYVLNNDCEFYIYPFKSSVQFERIEREGSEKYVGIIEQKNQEWVIPIVRMLQRYEKIKIVIMKHPLSIYEYGEDGLIVSDKKYSNLDVIIGYHSTLFIDYARAKILTPIICMNLDMKEALDAYVDYWANGVDELEKIIRAILNK